MAVNTSVGPYGGFRTAATEYAASSAAPVTQSAQAIRQMLASYLTPEAVTQQVSGFFAPAIEQAGMVGERAGAAGGQLAGALAGLAGNLPNMDPNAVALMLRGTARAGGSAQLMGEALGGQARLAQAMATQAALARREQETMGLTREAIAKEEEAGRIAADVLTPAATMGQIASQQLDRKALRETMKNIPIERRRMRLENMLARGQISLQALETEGMRQELKRLGLSDKDIKDIRSTYGTNRGGGTTEEVPAGTIGS